MASPFLQIHTPMRVQQTTAPTAAAARKAVSIPRMYELQSNISSFKTSRFTGARLAHLFASLSPHGTGHPRRSGNARQSFLDPSGPEPGGHHHGPDRRCGQERGLDARVERGEVKRRTCNGPFFFGCGAGIRTRFSWLQTKRANQCTTAAPQFRFSRRLPAGYAAES